ncbi:hypothetical protein HPP05_23765 [Corallococcus exiguus]|uniref:hypothetical protein n=1 Tax=Corallococcus exiguus TaxID=83462 RepID=UPI00149429E6|nr:hypothetical protein [Corallococcus exiguus]
MSHPVRVRIQRGVGEGAGSGGNGDLGGKFGRSSLDELVDGGQQESSNRRRTRPNEIKRLADLGRFQDFT